jgi:hypothetical protein
MSEFPRTEIGGVSVSRLVAGSNWFLGYSHQTRSRCRWITAYQTLKNVADVLEVFLRAGVDLALGPPGQLLIDGVGEAQQRVGRKMHLILTPNFEAGAGGPDFAEAEKQFDLCHAGGAEFCWPHTGITDRLYDAMSGQVRYMDRLAGMIRQRGMIPGLSSHRPEVIVAADKTGLDVASYICIYNAGGFLMAYEIDWTLRVIRNARKPVTTIKPLASGRLMPYVGLPFVWATLRDCDLVSVGALTPEEAKEDIEISLAALERRPAERELQVTRSKQLLQ